ncbi:MAG: carbohydrate ABC transporter permease [Anaerococcus sp.]|jgi:putative aldouronate transport system permease protein|nr:carbohydrate ABC transporter permease [Peptoniphilaceae bacterium]MDY3054467.1 carbohydrate ABC transporter permease [Anaerococcus sp.]
MKKNKYDPLAISRKNNLIFNIILAIIAISSLIPFIFVVIISFTDEGSLIEHGYQLIPKKLSLDAYRYIFTGAGQILTSYKNSIIITVTGVVIGLFLTSTYAYALSRKDFVFRNFFTKVAVIPMLFSGGLVSTYLIVTQFLNLKDSIWALIVPLLLNTFNIIVMRTFFITTIPEALIEAAKIDGANEFEIFWKVVLPISLPGLATIGLFLTITFWNDWQNAMLYITSDSKMPIQYLLIRIQNSTTFLSTRAGDIGAISNVAFSTLPKETLRMAIVVLTTAPIAMAYPFFQRYFIQGLTLGAVKE